jgi:hypothetical protein
MGSSHTVIGGDHSWKLLALSGGPYHESTLILGDFLFRAGHEVTITEDALVLAHAADMSRYDALVFNTRREDLPDVRDLNFLQLNSLAVIPLERVLGIVQRHGRSS